MLKHFGNNLAAAVMLVLLHAPPRAPISRGPEVTPQTYQRIRVQERLRLTAYPDPASPRGQFRALTGLDEPSFDGRPWTIGYGMTGPHIKEGMHWTKGAAEKTLEKRVDALAAELKKSCRTQLSQAQFDALLSFAYNVGPGVLLQNSRLMREVNARDFAAAARTMRRWTHARGQRFSGLVTRRNGEVALLFQ